MTVSDFFDKPKEDKKSLESKSGLQGLLEQLENNIVAVMTGKSRCGHYHVEEIEEHPFIFIVSCERRLAIRNTCSALSIVYPFSR